MDCKWINTCLIVICCVASGTALAPPRIISFSSEIIVAENNPLQLSCKGSRMVHWNISRYQNDSNEKITKCEVDYFGYVCTLTIPSTKLTDFGNYSCSYADSQLSSDVVKVYIAGGPRIVYKRPVGENETYQMNKTYTVSCIASGYPLPDIRWTTTGNASDNQSIMINVGRRPTANQELVIASPLSPYTIQSNLSFFATASMNYECQATSDSGSAAIGRHVLVSDTTEAFQVSSSGDQVFAGDNVSLSCSVNKYLYKDTISWKWKPFVPTIPLHLEQNKNSSRHDTSHSFQSLLSIHSIDVTQSGIYTCEAINRQTSKPLNKSIAVFVSDTSNSSLQSGTQPFKTLLYSKSTAFDNKPHIHSLFAEDELKKGSKLQLLCVGLKPLNWTNYPARMNHSQSNVKISCFQKKSFFECSLEIEDVTFMDTGTYECSYQGTQDGLQSDNLHISVADLPEIILPQRTYDNEKVCKVGHLCNISCTAQGNPDPAISWEKSSCMTDSCQTNFQPVENLMTKDSATGSYTLQSMLLILSNSSGNYRCIATNAHGHTEKEIKVIPSDEFELFSITPSYQLIFRNNTGVVKCTANKYYYDQLQAITWTKDGEILLEKDDKFKIQSAETPLSIVSELNILKAELKDSGEYFCTAVDKTTKLYNNAVTFVKVIESAPPLMRATNVNGSLIRIDTGTSFRLHCNADGSPNPQMVWFWNKQMVNLTAMPWIELNDNKTELVINKAEDEHSGVYACQAMNSGGSTLHLYTVTVALQTHKSDVGLITGITLVGAIAIVVLVVAVFRQRHNADMLPGNLQKYLSSNKLKDEDLLKPLNKDSSIYKTTTEDV